MLHINPPMQLIFVILTYSQTADSRILIKEKEKENKKRGRVVVLLFNIKIVLCMQCFVGNHATPALKLGSAPNN
jgi:hypothetical protein